MSMLCSLEATFDALVEALDILQRKLELYVAPDTTPHILVYRPSNRIRHRRTLIETAEVLQTQLKHVDRLLGTLGSVRNTLNHRYTAVHNALAPVSALPVEVLADIFDEVVVTDGKTNGCGLYAARAVSQVSSRWRRIATFTPHLWTDIHVTSSPQIPSGLIQASLERSAGASRNLVLNRFGKRPQHCDLDQALCDTLQSLSISSDDPCHEIMPSLRHTFPQLTTLALSNYTFSEQPTLNLDYANGFSAPMLSVLRLKDVDLLNLSFVGATLTSLHLFSVSLEHAWHRIGLDCPQLEHLSIRACEWHQALPVIRIPRLEFLEINIDLGCEDERAIPVETDCLRRLRLSGTDVLQNVQPMLFEYSTRAPNLQTFETYNSCGIEEIFDELIADPTLFPDLRHIAIYTAWNTSRKSHHQPADLAEMVQMLVENRQEPPIERLIAIPSIIDCRREWFEQHVECVVNREHPEDE